MRSEPKPISIMSLTEDAKCGGASFFRSGLEERAGAMRTAPAKRTIILDGRKTSVTIEDAFWTGLKEIAQSQRVSVSKLIAAIDATRKQSNLSSEIRIFVLEHFQSKSKQADLPHSDRAPKVSGDEGRSTQAWRGFAKRA